MQQQNRLGTERIPVLILKLGIPIMLSMMLQALYNVIDSIYISRLGDIPMAAVSLAYPLQEAIVAIANGIGIGSTTLVARYLGEQKQKDANISANTAVCLSVAIGVLFLCLGSFLTKAYVGFFTHESALAQASMDYIGISITYSIFQVACSVICFVLQGTGQSTQTLICLAIGVVMNVILDPVLMFVAGMGIKGAAWASIIGQAVSLIVSIVLLWKSKAITCFRKGEHICEKSKIGRILAVGIPTSLLQASSAISLSLVNKMLISFTPLAVTVFGLYLKVESFFFLPMHGLSNSLIPITSYNYGAGNEERTLKAYKTSLLYCYVFMMLGLVVFQTKPDVLISIFNPSPELLALSTHAFRRISLCFLGGPMIYETAAFLQGFGKGGRAAMITLIRQVCGVLPSAYILSKVIGLDGIWFCYLCGDIVGVAVCFFMLRYLRKNILSKRSQGPVHS
jgi:putative MATE family efflux protein